MAKLCCLDFLKLGFHYSQLYNFFAFDVLMGFPDCLSQECPPNGSFWWSLPHGGQPPGDFFRRGRYDKVSTGRTTRRDELKFAMDTILKCKQELQPWEGLVSQSPIRFSINTRTFYHFCAFSVKYNDFKIRLSRISRIECWKLSIVWANTTVDIFRANLYCMDGCVSTPNL